MIRLACLLLLLVASLPAHAAIPCAQLNSTDWMDLPDAPTTILTAAEIPATADLPAYCRVTGIVAPQVGFEIRLPVQDWNGKFLMQGCGGMCGILSMTGCEDVLAKNYVVANTDMGHTGDPSTTSWASGNPQARADFGWRATHVTTIIAKTIVARFYGTPARLAYFRGCSTGGRQGLVAAQRFPDDYDGIIVGAPPTDESGDGLLHLVWSARAAVDDRGRPLITNDKIPAVNKAALAACHAIDGVIPDPLSCAWDPAAMACPADGNGPDCLTPTEAGVIRRIYQGSPDFPGGMSRGSETEWVPLFMGFDGKPGLWLGPKVQALFRFVFLDRDPGPAYSLIDIDFQAEARRMRLVEPLYNAQNPDLSAFRAHGGKLILYHGLNDAEVPPRLSIAYYDAVTRTMGGTEATTSFARLFLIPGMAHCRRGPGGDVIDYLGALEAWVEQGQAPDSLMAYHPIKPQNYSGLPPIRFPVDPGTMVWQRPVYPYPRPAAWTAR